MGYRCAVLNDDRIRKNTDAVRLIGKLVLFISGATISIYRVVGLAFAISFLQFCCGNPKRCYRIEPNPFTHLGDANIAFFLEMNRTCANQSFLSFLAMSTMSSFM